MNALTTLVVYKHGAMWCFDDPARDLMREPFIAGMERIIERAVSGIKYAALGFNMTFSNKPFPGAHLTLIKMAEESGGAWYRCKELRLKGWLCPAVRKYFGVPPAKIYIMVTEIRRGA